MPATANTPGIFKDKKKQQWRSQQQGGLETEEANISIHYRTLRTATAGLLVTEGAPAIAVYVHYCTVYSTPRTTYVECHMFSLVAQSSLDGLK